MRKWLLGLGITTALSFGAPVVPMGDMKLVASFQGPYEAQFKTETYCQQASSSSPCVEKTRLARGDRPAFPDDNGDGLVSWSVFVDKKGMLYYEQISEETYAKMGKRTDEVKKEGSFANPTKRDFGTVIEALSPEVANAAIAFDAASGGKDNSGLVTSVTFSHTVTGSDTILVVPVSISQSSGGGVTTTGVTYNSVAMTLVDTADANGASGRVRVSLWYLIAPADGANNVVASISGTLDGNKQFAVSSMSYTGAAQSGQPDSSGKNSLTASTVTSFTVSTTVVGSDTWLAGGASENAGEIVDAGSSAGAGTTYRGVAQFNMYGADSNATVSTGSQSLIWGREGNGPPSNSGDIAGVIMSIAAAAAAAAPVDDTTFILLDE